ncbi:nucleoside hydrolase [Arenibacter palladensis]|uniref:nucleoside hydrolase n=1 Tax=Arenibacter palladensis TaxID=237373 RepID=UPI002FD3A66F
MISNKLLFQNLVTLNWTDGKWLKMINHFKLFGYKALNFLAFMLITPIFYAQEYPKLSEEFLLERLRPNNGKLNVVIDTDTYNEIDDQFAVVYALLSPEKINVEAIYAAPYFNTRSVGPADGMIKSHEEILRLMNKMGMNHQGLVYKGSEDFIKSNKQPLQSDAAKDLVNRAMASDGPLYVLALGAPTNIASAILMEPKIINKIIVVWLGGKGLNWDTAYEFNLKQDMVSSKILFDSGVPLIQVPTEPVSSHLLTTIPELDTYLKGQGEIGDYLIDIFKNYHKDHYAYSKIIWDIAVIAYVLNPSWFKSEIRHAPILTDQITYSIDNSRHFYRLVTYLNRDKIFGDMFRKIQNLNR